MFPAEYMLPAPFEIRGGARIQEHMKVEDWKSRSAINAELIRNKIYSRKKM